MLAISQAETTTLERFKTAVGLGVIYGPYLRKTVKRKPIYKFEITGFERVQAVICMLWPFLGEPKKLQYIQAFGKMRKRPHYRAMTECIKGHAYTPENTRRGSRGERVCATCYKKWNNTRVIKNRGV